MWEKHDERWQELLRVCGMWDTVERWRAEVATFAAVGTYNRAYRERAAKILGIEARSRKSAASTGKCIRQENSVTTET